MMPLDVYYVPLKGLCLIEASAGTGKTWTITGLYLRLLLENGYSVEQILVVTFTKAATAELRERIRTRIQDVRAALLSGSSDDPFCEWALEQWQGEARAGAVKQLEEARRRFDEAAIFTIHGFCQRVLANLQVPALLDEPEVVPDERGLLPGLVHEAWIRHCRSLLMADLLGAGKLSPDVILQDLQALLRKPYLRLAEPAQRTSESALVLAWQALREQWRADKSAILEDVLEANGLGRAEKSYKHLDAMLGELTACMEAEAESVAAILRRLTPTEFAATRLKKGRLPEHAFWAALEAWWAQADALVDDFRRRLIADVQAKLGQYKLEHQQIAYQDLLVLLHDSVQQPEVADSVRELFPAALIDEFQDTDPLQFGIFSKVYRESDNPVFLVGDPKQAIYSFRGADIFTYLDARHLSGAQYTLDTNRRSQPGLVRAVNTLFSAHGNSFLLADLPFHAVNALEDAGGFQSADGRAAFECWLLPDQEGKPQSKEAAAVMSVQATASEIARLLNGAEADTTLVNGQPLAPRDIAVLVSKHQQGRLMREALEELGIPAVVRSQSSVFTSADALAMLRVLEAVAEPARDGLVKAALLSDFLGYQLDQVMALADQDQAWGELIEAFLNLRERWQRRGFMAMWESLLERFAVFARLLTLPEGERRLTNLRHLATLMQQEADAEPALERQLVWLREQVADGESNEDSQLRLESDAERVQILTIHVSKGLEYPVVFCPFLWDGALLQKREKDRAEFNDGSGPVLDLGSATFSAAQAAMARERLAEKLRLLYVALTRAKYRCYAFWGRVKEVETAALSWLLLGEGVAAEPEAMAAALKSLTQADFQEALARMGRHSESALAWRNLPEDRVLPAIRRQQDFQPCLPEVQRVPVRTWNISSFTGLSESAHETEAPDHDAQAPASVPAEVEPVLPEGIHAFPRGAQAGVFWHELLEVFVVETPAEPAQLIEDKLRQFAIDTDWLPLVQKHLELTLNTPLDEDGLVLSRLESAVVEMEFTYPVARLTPQQLQTLGMLPEVSEPYRLALQALDFQRLSGYLKGFIDLICRHQGRYYVLDYKTNWLGPVVASYTPERMQSAVADSHYYLQYWLYTLALHRHLRAVLPGYDYERDMGGVRYVFLRGLEPGGLLGCYCARPSLRLIQKLDAMLEGH